MHPQLYHEKRVNVEVQSQNTGRAFIFIDQPLPQVTLFRTGNNLGHSEQMPFSVLKDG